ncbi:hypothetical protein N7520_002319 [Penicillium odoratum]|uniref:uncharacterized protein n=1 Tax=Penicillium odoratum TaxID=1167516 RepID=UPI002547B828|nr:uncharacterized protein N7520_002319 [Penicillium odoratum]KAJ5771790.1 hypothetical protein N7520_002319 [Penicillium odoratum]
MPLLPLCHILNLQKELRGTNAEISSWGCGDYGQLVKQWSDTSETQVVWKIRQESITANTKGFQGAVVRIGSANEAASVVRFATCHKVPLTTRSGGCSTSGSSTVHGGILLDLSNLRNVHVHPESRVVVAQGGALWKDVDVASA